MSRTCYVLHPGVCPECQSSFISGILDRVAPCFQDLVEELAAPHWYVDRKGETPPGKKEYYQLPIYNYHKVWTSDFCISHELTLCDWYILSMSEKCVHLTILACCGLHEALRLCEQLAQGFLSSPYTATYYQLAQRHPEVPRMTEKQREALRLYNALALSERLRMDMMLQPGDIQLLSNHTQLHTRSAFVDYPV